MAATTTTSRQNGRERRRWSRYELNGAVPAVLVTEEGEIACHIENVSLSGVRLRLAAAARPPAELRLDYHGEIGPSGCCAWVSRDSIGLNFGFSAEAVALTMACIGRPTPDPAGPAAAG